MKSLAQFIKTTLIGGLLVVLPLYVAVLLLAKVLVGLAAAVEPVAAILPGGEQLRPIAGALVILALCFLTGLVVRTGPGDRAIGAIQQKALGRIPAYAVLRSFIGRIAGPEEGLSFQPALVEIEEALAPAFIVEELDDGRIVVLVPSVPTPMAGSLFIMEAGRVHRVALPFRDALRTVAQWGNGLGQWVKAMH